MALRQFRHLHPTEFKSVQAIGLSGQMHGAVLLDKCNRVLRPAILWNDTRSTLACEEMMTEMSQASALAGSLIMPGFTPPKLRWVAHGGSISDVCVQPAVVQSYHPNAAERALLLPRYARFKALYAALQTLPSIN